MRAEALAALDSVDFVAIVQTPTAVDAIGVLKPDYYVKGQEFAGARHLPPRLQAEVEAVRAAGGDVRFTREPSPRATRRRHLLKSHAVAEEVRPFLDSFRTRHSFLRADDVLSRLDELQTLRVLVIGEAIIDEYNYCSPLGKSPKEAIVTTKYLRQERHAGGAIACANHVAGLCREVELVTGLGGRDSHETFVREHFDPTCDRRSSFARTRRRSRNAGTCGIRFS